MCILNYTLHATCEAHGDALEYTEGDEYIEQQYMRLGGADTPNRLPLPSRRAPRDEGSASFYLTLTRGEVEI